MKTKAPIAYTLAGGGYPSVVIPAGVRCDRAYNLPRDAKGRFRYWARGWRGMTPRERNFGRSLGFLLSVDEIKGEKSV
jgi:hypothetical protein